jgi:hypothetical protein
MSFGSSRAATHHGTRELMYDPIVFRPPAAFRIPERLHLSQQCDKYNMSVNGGNQDHRGDRLWNDAANI